MGKRSDEDQLDRTFFALSDRTRRAILARLAAGEATVSELATPHEMSLPAVLKHLRILRDAGLIDEEKDGRIKRCRLDPTNLTPANEWIQYYKNYWESQLDKLAKFIEEMD